MAKCPACNCIPSSKMVLDVKRKMTRQQAEHIMALSKIYSKAAFPKGMIEEAAEVLRNN